MNYFNKIPTIIYNGQAAKNILARANLSPQTRANKTAFYPYTMSDTDRIDTLSYHYYDNPGYTWLIWMTNNAIDPYYATALTENDLFNYIADKYGSLEKAMRKIAFYRNTLDKESRITISQYETIPYNYRKYYEPVLDVNAIVSGYRRKTDLDVTNTNAIITLTLSTVKDNFTVGEEIQVDGTHYAFVTAIEGNNVTCQHINGGFQVGDTITGKESFATGIITSVKTITQTLAYTEAAYWEPISYFQYEIETNDDKKNIQLLDVRYKGQVESELKRVMSNS